MNLWSVDWSLLVAGLGLFMLGMYFLELSLKSLLNQTAAALMRTATASIWLAVLLGTALTALMQSSSLVGLLVLAFVGAGIMPMRNALGVILGANLGTTITGWVVTWLGFSLELNSIALPLMGVGALLKVWMDDRPRLLAVGHLALGLGFLLFGLDAMKTGVAEVAQAVNIDTIKHLSPIWFLGIGMALAAVIQSSSAVVMMVLSAMHSGIIGFDAAAAMIIGADVGTSSTMILASATGAVVKRQVAAFHLTYNLFTGLFAFFILLPAAPYLLKLINIHDPLYSLVIFHSSFNFVCIFLALPFLGLFANWIERFLGKNDVLTRFIHKVPVSIPSAAVVALEQETRYLCACSLQLIAQAYEHPTRISLDGQDSLPQIKLGYANFLDHYESLKALEADIITYGTRINDLPLPDVGRINTALGQVRYAVYATKSVTDIRDDLELLWQATSPAAETLRQSLTEQTQQLLEMGQRWLKSELSLGQLQELDIEQQKKMRALQNNMYKSGTVAGIGFSSLLNVLRETDECRRELLRLFANQNG